MKRIFSFKLLKISHLICTLRFHDSVIIHQLCWDLESRRTVVSVEFEFDLETKRIVILEEFELSNSECDFKIILKILEFHGFSF